MAEAITIARPYAQAAYEFAQEGKALAEWSDALGLIAGVVKDPQVAAIIGNPKVEAAQLSGLILGVCGDKLNKEMANFVNMIIDADRLSVAPEIAELFDAARAEAEKTVNAELIAATEVDKNTQKKITEALKKRLGREVNLTTVVDASVLGGAIIRAGDVVIDGSVAGQLDRLASELAH